MRLEQFQYVVEVAKCHSMSKAAKQLFLSQPALSTAISNLETELGFQIFKRSFQGVALTDQGEELLKISKRIVENVETIPLISQQRDRVPTVNIAAVPAACNSLVIDLIHRLRAKNPNTSINIQELRPNKVLSALENGTADLCIGLHVADSRDNILKQVAQNDLHMEEVFQDTMYVYLPAAHPLAGKPVLSRQELAGETPIFFNDYVHMEPHSATSNEIQSSRNYFTFTDQASMKKAIARGLGYAILPWQMSVDDIYIANGQIVAVPLDTDELQLTTFLAYKRNAMLSSAEEYALVLLRRLYQGLQKQKKAAQDSAEANRSAKNCAAR